MNKEYCRFFRVRPEDVIGRSCLDTTPPEQRQEAVKKLTSCIRTKTALFTLEESVRRDGTTARMRWLDIPVIAGDGSGRVVEMMAVAEPVG